ncbi:hypothetical protein EJ06DRAFT_73613 [Trichodelitschia bisporula]|uniref:Uncharacterized protein n=1 Tax=Trichodelitschia bisporula TaxID=703511 RepID=A0A6G1HT11_9PEZI|nr:hypothetical protein EJ06DRAFT_73613 [Trichodelitschia bisporula]
MRMTMTSSIALSNSSIRWLYRQLNILLFVASSPSLHSNSSLQVRQITTSRCNLPEPCRHHCATPYELDTRHIIRSRYSRTTSNMSYPSASPPTQAMGRNGTSKRQDRLVADDTDILIDRLLQDLLKVPAPSETAEFQCNNFASEHSLSDASTHDMPHQQIDSSTGNPETHSISFVSPPEPYAFEAEAAPGIQTTPLHLALDASTCRENRSNPPEQADTASISQSTLSYVSLTPSDSISQVMDRLYPSPIPEPPAFLPAAQAPVPQVCADTAQSAFESQVSQNNAMLEIPDHRDGASLLTRCRSKSVSTVYSYQTIVPDDSVSRVMDRNWARERKPQYRSVSSPNFPVVVSLPRVATPSSLPLGAVSPSELREQAAIHAEKAATYALAAKHAEEAEMLAKQAEMIETAQRQRTSVALLPAPAQPASLSSKRASLYTSGKSVRVCDAPSSVNASWTNSSSKGSGSSGTLNSSRMSGFKRSVDTSRVRVSGLFKKLPHSSPNTPFTTPPTSPRVVSASFSQQPNASTPPKSSQVGRTPVDSVIMASPREPKSKKRITFAGLELHF